MPETPNIFSASPLRAHLGAARGKKAQFAMWLGLSPQVLTNWLRRDGIPAKRFLAVCALMDVTAEQYIQLAAGVSITGQDRPSAVVGRVSVMLHGHIPPGDVARLRMDALHLAQTRLFSAMVKPERMTADELISDARKFIAFVMERA